MFKKLFKGKEKPPGELVEQILQDLLEKGGFLLSAEVEQTEENEIFVDIFGEDEGLLKTKEGRLLLALQTYFNRVVQQHFSGQNVFVRLDSGSFFKERERHLLELADKLRKKALSTGRPVYLKKALSPFQRRQVHQFLTQGGEVKTSSVGEGFYKNICISPAADFSDA
ncbi:MAG: hypothetical protein OXM55_05620 [Bdellovibrionales bacterium]|nr:hypothetical protein [Bdellovibrionales bacterium]